MQAGYLPAQDVSLAAAALVGALNAEGWWPTKLRSLPQLLDATVRPDASST